MYATMYGWCHLVQSTKITAGLAETNGSLLPGGWFKVTYGLTACTLGPASGPMLERTLPFITYIIQYF